MKKVTVLHTVASVIEPLSKLFRELIPEVTVTNMLDESLLKDVIAAGKLTTEVLKRICQYTIIAEEMGSNLIINACSSIGESVKIASQIVHVPVVRIDLGMAEKAVETGKKIGVLATVTTTLGPTSRLIEEIAGEKGKNVIVTSQICEGAFNALLEGKSEEHDTIIANNIMDLAQKVEVIVLAQASMARVVPELEGRINVPVLSSPKLGVLKVRDILTR